MEERGGGEREKKSRDRDRSCARVDTLARFITIRSDEAWPGKAEPNLTSNTENQRSVDRGRFVVESPAPRITTDCLRARVFKELPRDELRGRARG